MLITLNQILRERNIEFILSRKHLVNPDKATTFSRKVIINHCPHHTGLRRISAFEGFIKDFGFGNFGNDDIAVPDSLEPVAKAPSISILHKPAGLARAGRKAIEHIVGKRPVPTCKIEIRPECIVVIAHDESINRTLRRPDRIITITFGRLRVQELLAGLHHSQAQDARREE